MPDARKGIALALLLAALTGCGGDGDGDPIRVNVAPGSHLGAVIDTLAVKQIIGSKPAFGLYARIRGAADEIKPGTYAFRRGASWNRILDALMEGRVMTYRLVIPEGWDLRRISARIARLAEASADSVYRTLMDTATARRYAVPGPTMEGYLYPATYDMPFSAAVDSIVNVMVQQYRALWTPARRARADSMEMTEREVITLASIVEKEAKIADEMPRIAAVYLNRLRIGMALYADPTVQYALGEHQTRLLYRHIDKVENHPYNTYTNPGLPPGPIASPSTRAVDAVLNAPRTRELYFVARPDGSHVFTRSLTEHNRARAQIRREIEAARRAAGAAPAPASP